jgi:hypothetical protein
MRILALDLGRRMGVADGDSADLGKRPPRVEAVTLRGTSAEKRVGFLGAWLHDRVDAAKADYGPPRYDLIITESPMNPAASKSDHATIDQLGYYFCLRAVAGLFGILVVAAPVKKVRKHFCGIPSAPSIRGRKRTSAEAAAAREWINEMVLARAILLGYLPADSKDWDCANAAALFEFACAKFARALPKELVMFGERA